LRLTGLADIAAALGERLGLRGPRLTLSAACASGLHALIRGAMMVRSGEVRQALVVATEASLHPIFLGSFQRLGVLAKPGAGCRPFDADRTGFLMSESAAAVLLEAGENGSVGRPEIHIERFALGGTATPLTGGDPHAITLRRLLAHVIDGRPVDLVHAHGTGTPTNDPIELAAVESAVVPSDPPPNLYSHKGALGHSLGASGLLAIVLNCQAHAHGVIPPNPRTTNPLPATRVRISHEPVERPVRRSIACAAGFGGPTAVVSLASR
jgi:3-oxoacyl-[acyl-carrier-protein] synthase II